MKTIDMKKLLVIYKTHLDIGFTDFSANIVDLYLKKYIPNAINTAFSLNGNGKKQFNWQTGSWILNEYLNTAKGEELERAEDAVRKGYIAWHALPFTAHTELFSEELLKYALGISHQLDAKYGKRTISAKATDVPGMTKAMIAPLVHAGVRFLHIGVNSASIVPQVPEMFRWVNDRGEELLVMYSGHYGGYTEISRSCAVTFQFAGDNCAPMTEQMVRDGIAQIQNDHPDCEVLPATLDDVAREMEKIRRKLPIVRSEIGDSWIHGIMTDPRKVFAYQAMLRYAGTCGTEERCRIYRHLLMVPEHTWGLDEKTFLADHDLYEKKAFQSARSNPAFRKMERSWMEQRAYVESAVAEAESPRAKEMVAEYKREPISLANANHGLPEGISINRKGEIVSLCFDGRVIGDQTHPLCSFRYEQFCEKDYERFISQYNRRARMGEQPLPWMLEDFTKIGMKKGIDHYRCYEPELERCSFDGQQILVDCRMPEEAAETYGAPRKIQYTLALKENEAVIDFAWFGKDENRMAEAMWLCFSPIVADPFLWRIEKIGQLIDPFNRVRDGGVQNYTTGTVENADLVFRFPDGGLITFGKPNLLNYQDRLINGEMISVNLYNNIWGTNFPMWYGEDGRIRIRIERKTQQTGKQKRRDESL